MRNLQIPWASEFHVRVPYNNDIWEVRALATGLVGLLLSIDYLLYYYCMIYFKGRSKKILRREIRNREE